MWLAKVGRFWNIFLSLASSDDGIGLLSPGYTRGIFDAYVDLSFVNRGFYAFPFHPHMYNVMARTKARLNPLLNRDE